MLQMENIALKLSEFSQNHHPSGVKILAKFIRRGISVLLTHKQKKIAAMDVKQKINSVELLYFDDCPSWSVALDNIKEALSQLKIPVNISLIRIDTHNDAQKYEFSGSPSIRVNKKDIFPVSHTNYALVCRMYQTKEGFRGFPTVEMIIRNIRDFFK